uniref:Secreted protein n=1 Tax=Rhipicephalus appendiculatus TaxID=34631 RepID=A0A131YD24_RHIAP
MDVLFLLLCSLGAAKGKNPAESLNAVPWLRSVWQSSHLLRTVKCLFRVYLLTFRMFLGNSHHGKAQNHASVQTNSIAVKGQHICAHSASLAYSQCNNLRMIK